VCIAAKFRTSDAGNSRLDPALVTPHIGPRSGMTRSRNPFLTSSHQLFTLCYLKVVHLTVVLRYAGATRDGEVGAWGLAISKQERAPHATWSPIRDPACLADQDYALDSISWDLLGTSLANSRGVSLGKLHASSSKPGIALVNLRCYNHQKSSLTLSQFDKLHKYLSSTIVLPCCSLDDFDRNKATSGVLPPPYHTV
jgi:hypothetical protein